MGPLKLRLAVYRHVVETGRTPSRQELTDMVGDIDTAKAKAAGMASQAA